MRAGNITLSLRKSFFFNFVMQIELSLKHALAKSTKGRKHAVRKNTREKKNTPGENTRCNRKTTRGARVRG